MGKKAKVRTNTQAMQQFTKRIANSHWAIPAVVRERLLQIADMTEASMEKQPEAYTNSPFGIEIYKEFVKIVREELAFSNDRT